jgi:hypothetical protein
MSRQRFIALLVAAVFAISAALLVSTHRNQPRDAHGIALLPSLADELGTVTAVSVRRASATPTATIHQQNGRWTVAQRGDYPADVSKLRQLLLALNDAKIVEQKTSNPASFPVIGVEDPSLPGTTGAEVSITARDGTHGVIVGKPIAGGNFVRRTGDNTSYSIEPGISFETEPRYWIESKLIGNSAAKIQSVEVKPAAGAAYTVRRTASAGTPGSPGGTSPGATSPGATVPVAEAFTLDGVPPGRKSADPASLAPSPTMLSGLTVDDVAPVGDIDFSKPAVATVTLADGNVVTITGAVSGDKHWVRLQASKDASLEAKVAARAFEIASYQFDAIFRPVEQLLVPLPPPPAAVTPKPAKKPAPSH